MNLIKVGDNKTPVGVVAPSSLLARLKELGGILSRPGSSPWPLWYVEAAQNQKPDDPAPWQQMMLDAAKEIEALQELAGRYHKQLYGS